MSYFNYKDRYHQSLHSFPTRRSSDLGHHCRRRDGQDHLHAHQALRRVRDRKSTRLNSSHRCISYAVFCLKKKSRNIPSTILLHFSPTATHVPINKSVAVPHYAVTNKR